MASDVLDNGNLLTMHPCLLVEHPLPGRGQWLYSGPLQGYTMQSEIY